MEIYNSFPLSNFDCVGVKKQCHVCLNWFHHTSLPRHIREQHTEHETLYKCDICGKEFSAKSNYGNHMRRIHKVYATDTTSNS